jgi:hypothetical protein
VTTSLEVIIITLEKIMDLRESTIDPNKRRTYGNNFNGFFRYGKSEYHCQYPTTIEDYYKKINGD